MPESNQYSFAHKELVTLLIKAADVHEGRWFLVIHFGIGMANVGPSEEQMGPGVIVGANWIGIQREDPNLPPVPSALIVDAAEVNPMPKS